MINKKGSAFDIMTIGIILLFFAITILVGFKMATEFNTEIQANALLPTEAKTASTSLLAHYPGVVDNSVLFLVIGLAIVTIVLASLVRVHPAFLVLFFIALVFFIFVAGALSNVYQTMAAATEFSALASQLTFTSTILNFLPFIIGVIGIILSMVMYKTWSNG